MVGYYLMHFTNPVLTKSCISFLLSVSILYFPTHYSLPYTLCQPLLNLKDETRANEDRDMAVVRQRMLCIKRGPPLR
jgi:hypothetical protein